MDSVSHKGTVGRLVLIEEKAECRACACDAWEEEEDGHLFTVSRL